MATFESLVKLKELSGPKCSFYSIVKYKESESEFFKWLKKMDQYSKEKKSWEEAFQIILYRLDKFAFTYGVEDRFLRHERAAHAFDTMSKEIRLYCFRASRDVVILFNGGIKTSRNPLDCVNVKSHFQFAVSVSEELDQLITDQSLLINPLKITSPDDSITIYQ